MVSTENISWAVGWAISALVFLPLSAAAQVAELRVGLSQFDEEFIDLDGNRFGRADETSLAITGEVLFEEPKFLKWAFSPQPYIGGSVNLGGNTSFGGVGLLWRQTIGKGFYGDIAAGVVVHNGTENIEPSDALLDLLAQESEFDSFSEIPEDLFEATNAEFRELRFREDNEIEFGTPVLIRLQGAIGYNVNEDWSGEIYVEHLSNGRGNIFSEDVNEGVNNIGIRAARKF